MKKRNDNNKINDQICNETNINIGSYVWGFKGATSPHLLVVHHIFRCFCNKWKKITSKFNICDFVPSNLALLNLLIDKFEEKSVTYF